MSTIESQGADLRVAPCWGPVELGSCVFSVNQAIFPEIRVCLTECNRTFKYFTKYYMWVFIWGPLAVSDSLKLTATEMSDQQNQPAVRINLRREHVEEIRRRNSLISGLNWSSLWCPETLNLYTFWEIFYCSFPDWLYETFSTVGRKKN